MTSHQPAATERANPIRLKWLLDALESGRREVSDVDTFEGEALSIGGEHIGWHGEWFLGNPRYVSHAFFARLPTGKIRRDDLLLVKDGATIGKVAIATPPPGDEAAVNEHVFILRINKFNDPRFYFYVLQSQSAQNQIQMQVRGSAQPGLNSEFRNTLLAPHPPRAIQSRIATALDKRTREIDALLGMKRELIERLRDQRSTAICTAVLCGLDREALTKPSDVVWLGTIPSHWATKRARRLFQEIDMRTTLGDAELLTVSHLTGVTPRAEKDVTMFEPESFEGYKLCAPGDLVINTMWAWMGALGVSRYAGMVSPAYNVYRPTPEGLTSRYLDYLVRVPPLVQELTRHSKGVWKSRLRLYPQQFFEIILPVPPEPEQVAIADHLDKKTATIDRLIRTVQEAIDRLQEYRSALITAAVTGQLEAGEAA